MREVRGEIMREDGRGGEGEGDKEGGEGGSVILTIKHTT